MEAFEQTRPALSRTAAIKISVLGAILALVAAGGLAVFYYTLPPSASASAAAGPGGNQGSGVSLIAVHYNGTSYQVPAKGPNSPNFGCPAGTAPSLCALLQQTCGNGVGPGQEPWKTCNNCIFDAGCTGNTSCDPYTHHCSTPATACMVAVYGGG